MLFVLWLLSDLAISAVLDTIFVVVILVHSSSYLFCAFLSLLYSYVLFFLLCYLFVPTLRLV